MAVELGMALKVKVLGVFLWWFRGGLMVVFWCFLWSFGGFLF